VLFAENRLLGSVRIDDRTAVQGSAARLENESEPKIGPRAHNSAAYLAYVQDSVDAEADSSIVAGAIVVGNDRVSAAC
jgi:hypothetical protein